MWPDRVSNPEPLTYESGALPTALCGPAILFVLVFVAICMIFCTCICCNFYDYLKNKSMFKPTV